MGLTQRKFIVVFLAAVAQRIFCLDVHTLVGSQPIATTGPTSLKYATDLRSGVEYTLSTWVWLWKQSQPPDHVLPVFTTNTAVDQPMEDALEENPSFVATGLNPSMLYNGAVPERFFFSASKDNSGNYANGFWSKEPVRYHEWIHVSFFFFRNHYSVFINGKSQGSSTFFLYPPELPFYRRDINNTVLYVGGSSFGRSASAMFQNFQLCEGIDLIADIQGEMAANPPPKMKTLYQLMREFGKYSLEGFTPLPYLASFYGEIEWGLCPLAVCGRVCIDESFYFSPLRERQAHRRSAVEDVSTETSSAATAHHAASAASKSKKVKTQTKKKKLQKKQRQEDFAVKRKKIKNIAERLRSLVLQQLDALAIDPYFDDMYADVYIDDLAAVSGDTELLAELENLSDAELNAINLWIETSMDGYDLKLDDYLDVVYPPDAYEEVVAEIYDSSDLLVEVEQAVDGETNSFATTSNPPRSHEKDHDSGVDSILPKKPKWNSRFLGKRRDVILDEGPAQGFSITDAVHRGLPTVKYFEQVFHSMLNVLTGNEESGTVSADQIDPVVDNTDTGNSVSQVSDVEETDYYEMYRALQPDVEVAAIQVQELYDSAMLWLNGRHLNFRSHAASGLDAWVRSSHELSQSAFFLALWLSFDAQLNADVRNRESADHSYLDPLPHPIRLALGFRAGYQHHNLSEYLYSSRSTDRGSRADHITKYNTNFFSRLLGFDISTTETDLSLYYALGNQSLRDVLGGSRNGADFCDPDEHIVREAKYNQDDHMCRIAVSYYWPVVQYVVEHYGQIETGVGKPEEIRLANGLGPLEFYEGEGALLHEVNAVEANGGNADAQMWMAMRYFWGYGGVQPNLAAARRLIENAAAAQHPEGLYNLGVLHQNGIAGYDVDHDRAVQYFRAAADHQRPFGMAVHAMGNHYLVGSVKDKTNITRAVEYYMKAISLGSADACYSLATLVQNRDFVKDPDIHLSLFLYAKAAGLGHVHSVYTLAQAFWDPESWLGEYLRDESLSQLKVEYPFESGMMYRDYVLPNAKSKAEHAVSDLISNETLAGLKYNSSTDIIILLPGAVDFVVIPNPLSLSCEVALSLSKYLGEHSYRVRDVARAGYDAFIDGDLWMALDYFDEASDLGSASSQENAAYVYDILAKSECGIEHLKSPSRWISSVREHFRNLTEFLSPIFDRVRSFLSLAWTIAEGGYVGNEARSGVGKYLPNLEGDRCGYYYMRMSALRRVQSSMNNEPTSMRMIADDLLSGEYPFSINRTSSAILYGRAAELGDVHSIMSLGWMFYTGFEGFPRNTTLSAQLFSAAGKWEVLGLSVLGYNPESTGGLAPLLAWIFVALEEYLWALPESVELNGQNWISACGKLFDKTMPSFELCLFCLVALFFYIYFLFLLRRRTRGA